MGKQVIKIRFETGTNTVHVPYLQLLDGVADAKRHMDRYHAIEGAVTDIANSLGTNKVMDDKERYEFYFTLLRAEKNQVLQILEEKKDSIIECVDPEKRLEKLLYKAKVVTV